MKKILFLFTFFLLAYLLNPQDQADMRSFAKQKSQSPKGQAQVSAVPAAQIKPMGNPPASVSNDFNQAVDRYIAALSKQTSFASWADASRDVYPLGPGSHSWAVMLKSGKNEEIGYLVVTADENDSKRYSLQEYGTGEYPLFSTTALLDTLTGQKLVPEKTDFRQLQENSTLNPQRLYFNALHAVWRIAVPNEIVGTKQTYIDAKTGVIIPVDDALVSASGLQSAAFPATGPSPSSEVVDHLVLKAFDPFDRITWLSAPPLAVKDFEDLKSRLQDGQKITWLAETFNKTVTWPLAVSGYQQWNEGEPYIRIEQEGTRYIPFSQISRWGKFYR